MSEELVKYSRRPGYSLTVHRDGEVQIISGDTKKRNSITGERVEDIESLLEEAETQDESVSLLEKLGNLGYESLAYGDETFEWTSDVPDELEEVVDELDDIGSSAEVVYRMDQRDMPRH